MNARQLEHYLHEHIPLSAAMGTEVVSAGVDLVELRAPLAPNINHRDTVFGGSASALAILAGWSLVHVALEAAGRPCRVVIQRNTVEYEAPMDDDFTARAAFTNADGLARFLRVLDARGRARVDVSAVLECGGAKAEHFSAQFVAIDLSTR